MFQADWQSGYFRDCNGRDNGGSLDPLILMRERMAGGGGSVFCDVSSPPGTAPARGPAGAIGPRPLVIPDILEAGITSRQRLAAYLIPAHSHISI